jgi:hypothetical protein
VQWRSKFGFPSASGVREQLADASWPSIVIKMSMMLAFFGTSSTTTLHGGVQDGGLRCWCTMEHQR